MNLSGLGKKWVAAVVATVSGWHYRVTVSGRENLPVDGGVLLLANHVSYVDALLLTLAARRDIRFVAEERFFHRPMLGVVLRWFDCIPISARRARDGIINAAGVLAAGGTVCLFPEGRLTRDGALTGLQAGYQLIARRAAGSHVVVARVEGLWGSVFSYYDGRLFTKLPRGWQRRVTVTFSVPLTVAEATPTRVAAELCARSRKFLTTNGHDEKHC